MIAYDRTALTNLKISEQAGKWRQSKLISAEQEKSIRDDHPIDFYIPNAFIRIILFIATVIAINASLGFVALFLDISSEILGAFLCLVTGVFLYVVLERVIITQKKYYQAGIDDALLYVALGFILAGIFIFSDAFDLKIQKLFYYLLPLPFIVFGVIRFADKLLTLSAIYCFFSFLFFQLVSWGSFAKSILPFVVMIASALLFLFSSKFLKSQKYEPWETPLIILKVFSLAAFYLGGNYMVVRELSQELLGMKILPGEDIALAPVFYSLTIIVPAIYIFWGIKKRETNFLRVGLLTAAFSVFTFCHYYSLMSLEFGITLAGAVLLALALAALKFLKNPTGGFTAKNLLNLSPDNPQFEAFLMADLSNPNVEISDKQDLFGGGRSGGAGAEGQY